MALSATIGGSSVSIQAGTLAIAETTNGRNSCDCRILGTTRYALNAEVIITENSIRIFGGVLNSLREVSESSPGGAHFVQEIHAEDFNVFASRRFAILTIPAGTPKAALDALIPYLTPFGVTLDAAAIATPALPLLPYYYRNVADVFSEIASLSSRVWEIDYNKVLHLRDPTTNAAPFNIIDGDGHAMGDIVVEPVQSEEYGNRIIVRWSDSPQFAYGFLSMAETFNFANSDTVVLGSQTYTFQTVLTDVNGNVLIGPNGASSIGNLAAAINADGAGYYAASTTQNSAAAAVWDGSIHLKAIARTPGNAGNGIACTTSATHGSWFGEGSVPLTTLARGADQALVNAAVAEDVAQQVIDGGPWEKVYEEPEVVSLDVATALAQAYLPQSLLTPRRVNYRTRLRGLHPGQIQTITIARRNFNSSCLITDVRVRHWQRDVMISEVSAIEGSLFTGSWRDTIKKWNKGGGGNTGSTVGGVTLISSTGQTRQYYLGGNEELYRFAPVAGTWIDVDAIQVVIDATARGHLDAFVRCRLRTEGGTVTARLRNLTTNTTAGTSAAKSTVDWSDADFAVTLTAGTNRYVLQIQPSLADTGAAGTGQLE